MKNLDVSSDALEGAMARGYREGRNAVNRSNKGIVDSRKCMQKLYLDMFMREKATMNVVSSAAAASREKFNSHGVASWDHSSAWKPLCLVV